jgi:outer membrane protein OmpA-like peptidoglycan-associated protein
MKTVAALPALLVALSFSPFAGASGAPPAAPVQAAAPQAAVDTVTPRLEALAGQMAAALQRIERLQTEIRALTTTVDAHGKSIGALTGRIGNTEMDIADVMERQEIDARAIRANTERLTQLQAGLTIAQQDLALLRKQLVQVEAALVKHSAWIAKQQVASESTSSTANEALQRAVAAGKLAEGKLVYESVLSEEMTQFQPYKFDLSDNAKAAIRAFADKLKEENGDVYLEIQGHTDTSGYKWRNQKISQQRAESVRDFLNQECGIPMHRMAAVAYGDSKPVADNGTKEGRAQNRRVTVVVLK